MFCDKTCDIVKYYNTGIDAAQAEGKVLQLMLEGGKLACYLGAGRIRKEEEIEPNVGIILNKKVGDEVIEGDFLAYVCANDENKLKQAERRILEIYKIY